MTSVVMAMVCIVDRARAVAFYTGILGPVLGLRLSDSDAYGDQFSCAAGIVRLTVIPGWQPGEHPVLGFKVEDAGAAVAALVAGGVEMLIYPGFGQDAQGIWNSPDGGARIAWFNDSEGNLLSLTEQH
jgi:catechol 2,3-dioxygenase-like lactoylglutathione lyase family enzyme